MLAHGVGALQRRAFELPLAAPDAVEAPEAFRELLHGFLRGGVHPD